MSMLNMLILTSCSLSIMLNNSLSMIISIIFMTIMGTMFLVNNNMTTWLSFLILMLMVGGLMILYVFILSMNSNEMFNMSIKMPILIISMISITMMNKSNDKKTSNLMSNMIFQSSSMTISMIMTMIIIVMMFSSKMIMNPSSPSKSLK